MPRDLRLYLHEALEACRMIASFAQGKSESDYENDPLLRSAIERQFCIIGEAMFQAEKVDSELGDKITDLRRIINFRHVLIHGYHAIQNDIVWGVVETQLSTLETELSGLIDDLNGDDVR